MGFAKRLLSPLSAQILLASYPFLVIFMGYGSFASSLV